MRKFILLLLLFIGFHASAESSGRELPMDYKVDSVQDNPNLAPGISEVVVRILNPCLRDQILYGYNQKGLVTPNKTRSFQFQLDSGQYTFRFYPKSKKNRAEITTLPIRVKPGTTTYLSLKFRVVKVKKQKPLHVRKPVIYLYPTEKTNVSLVVKPKGEMSFAYPEYTDKWECTAFPSGEILIGDSDGYRNSYNYLFWEAKQTVEIDELNKTEGMVVAKEDLMLFLESSLDEFGFTSKEKMDFITYWAPLMIKHEATEIRFMFNEECTFFADLEIDPKPDNLLRFYMIWNPTDAFYIDADMMLEVPQQIRSGFTVLEWGGMEISRGDRPERVK